MITARISKSDERNAGRCMLVEARPLDSKSDEACAGAQPNGGK